MESLTKFVPDWALIVSLNLVKFGLYLDFSSYAPVAQWIEHWSSEPGVGGSNPSRRAKTTLVRIR